MRRILVFACVLVLVTAVALPTLAQSGYPGPATPTPDGYPVPPTATQQPTQTPLPSPTPWPTPRPFDGPPTGVTLRSGPTAHAGEFPRMPFILLALAFAAVALWRKR